MPHSRKRSRRLPACPEYPSMVLAAGAAALKQLPEQDAAVIARSRVSVQRKIPNLGDKYSLELITALGIFFAQKCEPAQVQAEPVREA